MHASPRPSSDRRTILARAFAASCDPLMTSMYHKNGHMFVFRYHHSQVTLGLRAVGKEAANPDSEFSWYDAALLSKSIRDTSEAVDNAIRGDSGGGEIHGVGDIGDIEF